MQSMHAQAMQAQARKHKHASTMRASMRAIIMHALLKGDREVGQGPGAEGR